MADVKNALIAKAEELSERLWRDDQRAAAIQARYHAASDADSELRDLREAKYAAIADLVFGVVEEMARRSLGVALKAEPPEGWDDLGFEEQRSRNVANMRTWIAPAREIDPLLATRLAVLFEEFTELGEACDGARVEAAAAYQWWRACAARRYDERSRSDVDNQRRANHDE